MPQIYHPVDHGHAYIDDELLYMSPVAATDKPYDLDLLFDHVRELPYVSGLGECDRLSYGHYVGLLYLPPVGQAVVPHGQPIVISDDVRIVPQAPDMDGDIVYALRVHDELLDVPSDGLPVEAHPVQFEVRQRMRELPYLPGLGDVQVFQPHLQPVPDEP